MTISSFLCGEEDIGFNTLRGDRPYAEIFTRGDFMYKVARTSITTIDISNAALPKEINVELTDFDIASSTLFDGIFFISSARDLHIYEINSDGIPNLKTQTGMPSFDNDQTACDPYLRDATYAYVALADQNLTAQNCRRLVGFNQLRIFEEIETSSPLEVNRLELQGPRDLALDHDILFIADGTNGLLIYDKSDIANLVVLHHLKDFLATKVIVEDGTLLVANPTQLRQYNYSDIMEIELLSTIEL